LRGIAAFGDYRTVFAPGQAPYPQRMPGGSGTVGRASPGAGKPSPRL